MQSLNTLLDSSGDGWFIEEVFGGINNAGQIAASGRVVGDRFFTHALLLTPIPEPSTLMLCVMGMSAIRLLRARPRLNDRKHVMVA
ncbi:MAG: hypothetical protein WD669_09935 [Pirellulales bacterium]